MKTVMVLAGGNDQIALIEELRLFFHGGVEIILVDMSDNVRAIPYADRFLQISTMDRESVLRAAQEFHVDYILTACGDQPLSTMAYVAEELGLPTYLSQQDVRDLTNKRFMKDKMVKHGIPTARHIYVDRGWDGVLPDFRYPLVVKPVDSNGSKGVKKVCSEDGLRSSLEEAFRYSISGDVIVEEYVSGEELSVDAWVEGGVAKILSVTSSRKIRQNDTSFTIVQSHYPASASYEEDEVLAIVQQIVDAWKLRDVPLLVQMIVNEEGYRVLEFSARMGGGSKYHLIHVLSGVDIMKVYVELIMGRKPHIIPSYRWSNAIMSYVYCFPGTYARLDGFDRLKASGDIYSYFVYRQAPSEIQRSDTSSDRVAGFLIVGNSEEEVNRKLAYANSELRVLNNEGVDIMRHDIY